MATSLREQRDMNRRFLATELTLPYADTRVAASSVGERPTLCAAEFAAPPARKSPSRRPRSLQLQKRRRATLK